MGVVIVLNIVKPFIKFDPHADARLDEMKRLNKTVELAALSNSTQEVKPEDIQLFTPYAITASVGLLLTLAFLVAQFVENRNTKEYEKTFHANLQSLKKNLSKIEEETWDGQAPKQPSFFQKLFFSDRVHKGKALAYMLTQIALLFTLMFFVTGYITVISRFMLTYYTKGPAQFTVSNFLYVQMIYWVAFVSARFLTAFVAYKLNPILFYIGILTLNLLVCALFIIPQVAMTPYFFWYGMVLMGLTSGPIQPTAFMAAKSILVDYNSFVLSLFSTGMGVGAIFFQNIGGVVLEKYKIAQGESWLGFADANSSYVVAYLFFLPSLLCFLIFMFIYLIYLKFVHLIRVKK